MYPHPKPGYYEDQSDHWNARPLCLSHCRKSEGVFVNTSGRPACQAITDRGVAMILLLRMGPNFGLAEAQKKKGMHALCVPSLKCTPSLSPRQQAPNVFVPSFLAKPPELDQGEVP